MQGMTIDSAAIRLTDIILGQDEPDLEQALKAIAVNIGVLHIAYVPLSSEKSAFASGASGSRITPKRTFVRTTRCRRPT